MPDSHDTHWQQLAARAAREISLTGPEKPPLGFSSRIAARAMTDRRQQAPDPWAWGLRWLLPASAAPALAAVIFYAGVSMTPNHSNDSWTGMQPDPLILLDL